MFFQVLEGDYNFIKDLYLKIEKDERHWHVIKIIDNPIGIRAFNDYETGFGIVDNQEKFSKLKNYVNWLKIAELHSIANVIKSIENFVERSLD